MSDVLGPKPNILFIMTDEQRYDALGCCGNAQIQTPHLDAMARDSVNFTNSFCPYAVCTPSRYSILTGLYVHQHRGRTNRSTPSELLDTYPKALTRAGYRTKAFGKMHFTPTYLDVGFERMILAEQHGDGRLEDDYHRELREAGLVDAIDLMDQRPEFRKRAPKEYWENFGALVSDLPEEWHSTTWIGDRAVNELERWNRCGNMMTVSFVKPHHPFDPPRSWAERYNPDEIDPLPGWTEEILERDQAFYPGFFPNKDLSLKAIKRITAHYYATISHIDHQIGRMIDVLKRRGQYDNTMIIFTSDHGEFLGFHHMILKNNYYYDPIIRVPLLIKFPGNKNGGTKRDTLTNNIDLAPTMLAQAGITPSNPMAGFDLSNPENDRPYIFAEAGQGMMYMARSRTHKLCLTKNPEMRLFTDLERDPLEMENLYKDPAYSEIISDHREAISDWLMFDALTPPCQNTLAPCVRRICTVCPPGECTSVYCNERLEDMLHYFEEKASPLLEEG